MNKRPTAEMKRRSGAEMRAQRDERLGRPYEMQEASRREQSFLKNITGAQDDLEWILTNRAWTQLGFERVAEWWDARVGPTLDGLDLKPSQAMVERVIRTIAADEEELPKVQRRTQREIASIARTSQSKVSRSLADAPSSTSDLENDSGDVGPSLPDVPGESPPADIPTSQVALVAGQPGSNSSDAPVSEGPAGESTANRPGMSSSLARDEVTPPTSGPVGEEPVAPQPVAVPPAGFGVFTAGDEEGRSAGPDLPSDPASELMRAVDGLAAALRDVDYDVAGPMLTDTEFKRFEELALVLPGSVKLLRRWASAA
jgi:hypothetical protein